MKIYVKDNNFSTEQIDESWIETEDEIVSTPIGYVLKSNLNSPEIQNQLANFDKSNVIKSLKEQLQKYKYDVEQVELFGMQRDDYELKKRKCAEIITQLKTLEK